MRTPSSRSARNCAALSSRRSRTFKTSTRANSERPTTLSSSARKRSMDSGTAVAEIQTDQQAGIGRESHGKFPKDFSRLRSRRRSASNSLRRLASVSADCRLNQSKWAFQSGFWSGGGALRVKYPTALPLRRTSKDSPLSRASKTLAVLRLRSRIVSVFMSDTIRRTLGARKRKRPPLDSPVLPVSCPVFS